MNGLVKNNYKTNPDWIKSCENFRNGENPFTQPKYFHTDDNMYIRDWYKAAYPDDTWGYKQIDPNLRFKDVCIDKIFYIKDKDGRRLDFNDSIVRSRIRLEIDVNEGSNFGYIITD